MGMNILTTIFLLEERWTRRHEDALAKKQCRQESRQFSFSFKKVNEWKILPADCVGPSSVDILKRAYTIKGRDTLR